MWIAKVVLAIDTSTFEGFVVHVKSITRPVDVRLTARKAVVGVGHNAFVSPNNAVGGWSKSTAVKLEPRGHPRLSAGLFRRSRFLCPVRASVWR